MQPGSRLNEVSYLIHTALDSEEEYLYDGEMSSYVRTYAGDAADELSWLFRSSPPSPDEVDICVKALTDPERIKRGRSKDVLIRLRERSRPLLEALSMHPDPQVRIFALETGATSLNPYFHNPLYGTIDLERRLLEDPDESVRIVALSTSQKTILHNAAYLKYSLEGGNSTPVLDLLTRIVERLGDPSARVRAEAENVVRQWADEAGEEALRKLLARE